MSVPGHAYDLFLSYAHVESEWVNAFKKAFSQEFHEREGRAVSIWQDSTDLRPGTKWTDELKHAVKTAAALLAIVSPAYDASSWCREERRFLIDHYKGLENLKIDALYRFFKIFKLPTERALLAELQDVRFFHPATKEPFPLDSQEFRVGVAKAVTAMRELFRLMCNGLINVYLATGPMEMEPDRIELENELTGHGYKVRPGYALSEEHGPETLAAEIEPCSRAIFLLGGHYDRFIAQQLDQAIASEKPCLFWIHPRLSKSASGEQEALIKRIHDRPLPAGSEILGGQSIPGLWKSLQPKLKDAEPKPASASEPGKPLVYLIFDATLPSESAAASHLTGILSDRNLTVIPSTDYDSHQDRMTTSDGALLLRSVKSASEDWWLRLLAQQLSLSTRLAAKALVLGDSTRIKLDAEDIQVLTYSQPFPPRALDPFIERLQRAKGANAGR